MSFQNPDAVISKTLKRKTDFRLRRSAFLFKYLPRDKKGGSYDVPSKFYDKIRDTFWRGCGYIDFE